MLSDRFQDLFTHYVKMNNYGEYAEKSSFNFILNFYGSVSTA